MGDEIMGSGMARGAAARGVRIAFGDRDNIVWSDNAQRIYAGNPNVAPPGSERASDLEWIRYYRGNRIYNRADPEKRRWIWSKEFKPVPGEFFFTREELRFGDGFGSGFIVVEPNVPRGKIVAPNKQWSPARFQQTVLQLLKFGCDVRQFYYPGMLHQMPGVRRMKTTAFRQAASILRHASLVITGEGGLHHAAAAVGAPAVVIFGNFIPPSVTGYDDHANLVGDENYFCGSWTRCPHCEKALASITVGKVLDAVQSMLLKNSSRGEKTDGQVTRTSQLTRRREVDRGSEGSAAHAGPIGEERTEAR